MAAFSFRPDMQGEMLQWFTPSLKQYASLAAVSSYWRLLGTSGLMALAVAVSGAPAVAVCPAAIEVRVALIPPCKVC